MSRLSIYSSAQSSFIPFGSAALRSGQAIRRSSFAAAFTLVELLVAMSVLVLLLLMVTQLMNSATQLTGLSNQRLDSDNQAREVFDRMAHDFNGMIRRPDVDCTIYPYTGYAPVRPDFKNPATNSTTAPGNDFLYFFSQTAAITAATGQTGAVGASRATTVADAIALVGYRVWESTGSSSDTPLYALERLAGSTALNVGADRPMLFLASASGKGSYLTNPSNVDGLTTIIGGTMPMAHADSDVTAGTFHCIGDQVFRLEFALVMTPEYIAKNGGASYNNNTPYWKSIAYNATPPTAGVQDPRQIQDMRDVSAIIVTIALLDKASRVKIPGYDALNPATGSYATDMAQLKLALIDGDTPSVATAWADTVMKIGSKSESPSRNISNIARSVASRNIRIYQRTFNLK